MKTKKVLVVVPDDARAAEMMEQFAKCSSALKKIEADMEISIQKIRAKYDDDVQRLRSEISQYTDSLQAYAEKNKERFFSKKKSHDMLHGMIGFRTGTPKVVKDRKITIKELIIRLRDMNLGRFIRTTEELNKEVVIQERDNVDTMRQMKAVGVTVVQDETFFVEVYEEDLA